MLAAATATIEQYRGHWALNRLVNDRGRFILGLMILDLDFVAGGMGLTAAGLRAAAAAYAVSSPGRITALLASLRLLGFLQVVPAEDRREQRLAPTERFLALHRDRWDRHFQALALLCPQAEAARRALAQPACLGALAHVLINTYRQGWRVVGLVPAMRAAAERDVGVTVLFSLLTSQAAGQPVSIAALARRFSVSRAHILTILREAEAVGLAEPARLRGGYAAGPALQVTLRRFFAVMFQLQQHAIAAVWGREG